MTERVNMRENDKIMSLKVVEVYKSIIEYFTIAWKESKEKIRAFDETSTATSPFKATVSS